MASKRMYSMMDFKVGAFMNPIVAVNDAEAIRIFTTWVNSPSKDTSVSLYPEQFSLFYVGEFDDKKGVFEQLEQPKELILGVSVQEEAHKKYTVEELLTVLRERISS